MHHQIKTKDTHKKYCCTRFFSSLQFFTKEDVLNKHKDGCLLINGIQKTIYEKGIIKFKNHDRKIPIVFKIYADTECTLKKVNVTKKHTRYYQKLVPNTIAAKLICTDDRFTETTKFFTGNSCVKELLEWIIEIKEYCSQIINKFIKKQLEMTLKETEEYENADTCWRCSNKIEDNDKTKDYNHFTGKYIGPTHKKCSGVCKISKRLPIFFSHNLQGYDGHFIFREINNIITTKNDKDKKLFVEITPKSCGKYMSIMTSKNRAFLDSLSVSYLVTLDTLSVSLEDTDFKHLLSDFPVDKLNLLKRKDAYPYEWFNDTRKFLYPRLLPKKPFHLSANDGTRRKDSKKNNRHISDERYAYLENVWNVFGFNTFRDFHNPYLKKDVLLLADAFEKFLNTALNCYNLDPFHHYSLPGF